MVTRARCTNYCDLELDKRRDMTWKGADIVDAMAEGAAVDGRDGS